jgi:hypothetical protein
MKTSRLILAAIKGMVVSLLITGAVGAGYGAIHRLSPCGINDKLGGAVFGMFVGVTMYGIPMAILGAVGFMASVMVTYGKRPPPDEVSPDNSNRIDH